MDEQNRNLRTRLAERWERLIAVDVLDEEDARLGRLFNILMVIGMGIPIGLILAFVLIGILELAPAFIAGLGAAFPLVFISLSLFCLTQARRGRVRQMITFYVWVNFFGIMLAVFTFDGVRSAAWLLYIWTITIAGTLLAPGYALGMTGMVVGYFLLLLLLTWLGLYTPPLTLGPEGRELEYIVFTMTMLVSAVGLLTYLNMRSLRESLGRLRATTRELQAHRATLEQQVAERTQELARRAMQLETAAEVAREATAIRNVDELLDETVRLISDRFGFYHAGVFLVDDAREYAVLQAASSGRGERTAAKGFRLKIGAQGIVGRTVQSGQPHIVPDVKREPFYFAHPDLPETRSEMTLPLRLRGEVIGVLDVQSTEPGAFSDEDVATLGTMADQVAVALDNAHLFEQTQASLREIKSLYRDYSKEAWGELISAGRLHGYTYDQVSVSPVTADRPPEVQQVLREEHVVTVGGKDGGSETVLAVPVSVRGEAIGVLDIRKSGESGEWTPEEMLLAKRISDQLGLALESARLYQDTQRRAEREQLVGQMTAQFTRSLDMEAVLRTAVRELGQLPQVAEVSVHVVSPEASPAASEGEEA